MNATADLTTALTNALPVLNALMVEAIRRYEYDRAKWSNILIDGIHSNSISTKVDVQVLVGFLESAPWFREGQPVIDELRRFL